MKLSAKRKVGKLLAETEGFWFASVRLSFLSSPFVALSAVPKNPYLDNAHHAVSEWILELNRSMHLREESENACNVYKRTFSWKKMMYMKD